MCNRRWIRGLAGFRGWALSHKVLLGLLLALSLNACGKAEQEKRIAEIQKAADAGIAKAEQEAQNKIAALESQIEAIKAEAADASAQVKAAADEAISKAQLNVDEAAKAAQAALSKAREAYKSDARTHLADLNHELTDVTTQAAKIPAKDKAAYDKVIKEVVGHQKEIANDIAAFDKATLDTFKTVKAKLTKDLALMKAAIKTAKSKLPKH